MGSIPLSNGVQKPQLGEEEDIAKIAALDTKRSAFFSHYDPAMVEWFARTVEERKTRHDSNKERKNW